MALSECPECTFHLTISPDWSEGTKFECPDCGAMLVVVALNPLQIEKAPE